MLFGNHRSVLTALGCTIVVDRSGFVIAVQSAVPPTIAAPASSGPGQMTVDAGGVTLTVFTYRPGRCRVRGTLIVFHGLNRNADAYRNNVRPLADRLCLFVAALLFDERRFPTWRYQRGGIVDHGAMQPERSWTVGSIAPLIRAVQDQAGTAGLPYYLAGHSAGAQFLSRVAAYTQTGAARIVIANPSTYVLPSTAEDAPYGFRRLKNGDVLLRAYLGRPITLLLGV
jgi:poly(3-hydroxybutyrate) depolymerase